MRGFFCERDFAYTAESAIKEISMSKPPLKFWKMFREVVSMPTAAFHEDKVSSYVENCLEVLGVPFQHDGKGNIVAHLKRGRKKRIPVALVAHMDHPGFLVERNQKGPVVKARVMGGVGPNLVGRKIRFFGDEEIVTTVVEEISGSHPWKPTHVKVESKQPIAADTFGMWNIPVYSRKKKIIRSRVIDDLAGVAVMIEVLNRLSVEKGDVDLYCCFTRAEEVGLVGANALARSRVLPKETRIISIETSKKLPHVSVQGKGFTIRVGDHTTIFDPEMTEFMRVLAREMVHTEKGFKYQMAVLDGGGCEATCFNVMGYQSGGVALPLGNYHNRTPSGGVAPEYIHEDDLKTMCQFLTELSRSMHRYGDVRKQVKERLSKVYDNYKSMF
jgi:endoglucanase